MSWDRKKGEGDQGFLPYNSGIMDSYRKVTFRDYGMLVGVLLEGFTPSRLSISPVLGCEVVGGPNPLGLLECISENRATNTHRGADLEEAGAAAPPNTRR